MDRTNPLEMIDTSQLDRLVRFAMTVVLVREVLQDMSYNMVVL